MSSLNQLIPLNSQLNNYCGFISVLNEEFYVQISLSNTTSKDIHLKGSKKMWDILKCDTKILTQHLKQCNTIPEMLKEIQNMIEQKIGSKSVDTNVDLTMEYTTLFEQLQECGWDKVQHISPSFDELNIVAYDASNREHVLKIKIPEKFPNEAPKCECDLPQDFVFKWLHGDTLSSMLSMFQEKLDTFTEFWNNLDEIDSRTWVLEPEKPRRSDCKRRIALTPKVSLLLVVNPLMPTVIPTCNYMGPERSVEALREKFNKNIRLWSEYDSLLTNLQQVLELEFPSPATTTKKEEFCLECGICYSHLLGTAIPEINCENLNCIQAFHQECLYEYIRMLPDVKSSFNKLFGQCPYCNTPLWCSLP